MSTVKFVGGSLDGKTIELPHGPSLVYLHPLQPKLSYLLHDEPPATGPAFEFERYNLHRHGLNAHDAVECYIFDELPLSNEDGAQLDPETGRYLLRFSERQLMPTWTMDRALAMVEQRVERNVLMNAFDKGYLLTDWPTVERHEDGVLYDCVELSCTATGYKAKP